MLFCESEEKKLVFMQFSMALTHNNETLDSHKKTNESKSET